MIHLFLAQQSPEVSPLATFLPILLLVLIFYFLMYRPARKRQKSLEVMVGNLKNGDKVITTGGIFGTVAGIRETTILLKVSDRTKIEVAKSAIAALQKPETSTEA